MGRSEERETIRLLRTVEKDKKSRCGPVSGESDSCPLHRGTGPLVAARTSFSDEFSVMLADF